MAETITRDHEKCKYQATRPRHPGVERTANRTRPLIDLHTDPKKETQRALVAHLKHMQWMDNTQTMVTKIASWHIPHQTEQHQRQRLESITWRHRQLEEALQASLLA